MVLKLYDFMCLIVRSVMVLQCEVMRLTRMCQIIEGATGRSSIFSQRTLIDSKQVSLDLSCKRAQVVL